MRKLLGYLGQYGTRHGPISPPRRPQLREEERHGTAEDTRTEGARKRQMLHIRDLYKPSLLNPRQPHATPPLHQLRYSFDSCKGHLELLSTAHNQLFFKRILQPPQLLSVLYTMLNLNYGQLSIHRSARTIQVCIVQAAGPSDLCPRLSRRRRSLALAG